MHQYYHGIWEPECKWINETLRGEIQSYFGSCELGIAKHTPSSREWIIIMATSDYYFKTFKTWTFLFHIPTYQVVSASCLIYDSKENFDWSNKLKIKVGSLLSWRENEDHVFETCLDDLTQSPIMFQHHIPCTSYYKNEFIKHTMNLPLDVQYLVLFYLFFTIDIKNTLFNKEIQNPLFLLHYNHTERQKFPLLFSPSYSYSEEDNFKTHKKSKHPKSKSRKSTKSKLKQKFFSRFTYTKNNY